MGIVTNRKFFLVFYFQQQRSTIVTEEFSVVRIRVFKRYDNDDNH